jgi:MoaA/NifB/PqqE/SkfB family radical SAM enzyme
VLQRISSRTEPWGRLLYSFEDDEFSAVYTGGEMLPSGPIGVGWVIIGACNLVCRHCYGNAEALPRRAVRGDAALQVADALVQSGVMRVVISGGEPLLHSDTIPVVRRLIDGGVSVILGTN